MPPPTNVNIPAYAATPVYAHEAKARQPVDYVFGGLRLVFGALFFWAFVDKLFGLGYATPKANAWLNGGSPTAGFLGFGAEGPFQGFYNAIAGHAVTDWLFMVGLLAIGASLLLGVGVRIASYAGALLTMMMWSVALPPANNPVVDDHVVYALALLALGMVHAGRTLGLGAYWANVPLVKRYPILE